MDEELSSTYEEDDEVFTDIESKTIESSIIVKQEMTRVRRISDVIDSVGDEGSGQDNKKPSCLELCDDNLSIERCIRDGHIYSDIKESSSNRILSETRDKHSPPPTPCSDLGYDSTSGLSSPPSQLNLKTKWFHYSTSSIEHSLPSPKYDTTDARVYQSYGSRISVREASMPVHRDSDEYNMSHTKRGYAIIFNHENFNSANMPFRKGTHEDVKQLQEVYKLLGFEVEVYDDLKYEELKKVLSDVAERNHSDCDCVIITVLTHGLRNGYLYAEDHLYPTDYLWAQFTGDKCTTLAGKPKIFIVQACRGESLDGGVKLVSQTETDSGNLSYKIPAMADFLVAFSTAEGFYSWRHPENGTWFIQSFCQILKVNYQTLDFLKILVRVSQRVAVNYESFNDIFSDKHEQKQVPNINSTTIRDIYFRPKNLMSVDQF